MDRTDVYLGYAALTLSLAAVPAFGQVLISDLRPGGVRMFNSDMAVLETPDPRKDLFCSVTPGKAVLGFDLKFHAGYEVTIPLKELSGSENMLTIIFRVVPETHKDEPQFFYQKIRVPSIEDDAKGDAYLQGTFDLGEGKYHIDWLIRDRAERVCSFYWDTDASLSSKDRQISLVMNPSAVRPSEIEQFKEEPPVERAPAETPLIVKVLVNFAPQNSRASALKPTDTSALVSILRTISRDPRIGKFTLVAFNLHEQRVVYRQDAADRIDFPKLGDALNTLNLGTVDLKRLSNKNGETEFLTELIRKEAASDSRPDALIFAGPKALLESNVPQQDLKEVGDVAFPVFYMNYNLFPQQVPWRDAIGNAVKFFKGYEYTITRPRDLWFAVSEMVTKIVKSKQGKQPQVAAR